MNRPISIIKKSHFPLALLNGYTIIELLIVISIMVLLFSFTFTSYRSYQKRQLLESAVRQVTSDLRLAQEYAISGKKPSPSPCDNAVLQSYSFQRESSTQYRLQAVCGSSQVDVKGPVELPSGVQMSFSSGDTLSFNVLGRGATPAQTITLSLPSGGASTRQIQVKTSGEIN